MVANTSEPVHEDKNIARYLVDYLLRKGYMKTAQAVTAGAKIEVCLFRIMKLADF
jgi:hypothetical protein